MLNTIILTGGNGVHTFSLGALNDLNGLVFSKPFFLSRV